MFEEFSIDPQFCARLCLTLFHSLWQFALLELICALSSRIKPTRSFERQYATCVGMLCLGLFCLPVTYLLTDARRIEQPASIPLSSHEPNVAISSHERPSTRLEPVRIEFDEPERPEPSTEIKIAVSPPVVIPQSPPEHKSSWLRVTSWLAAAYLLGVAVMLARLFIALLSTQRMLSRSVVVGESDLLRRFRALGQRCSLKVIPVLVQTKRIVVPKVVGLLRPAILLPTSLLSGLSPQELDMILCHELAHLRRHDLVVQLLQRLAEVVLFFNPALWYLSRRISTLREYCCDELTCRTLADTQGEPRQQYAFALLRIAELAHAAKSKGEGLSTTWSSELTSLAASGRSPSELRRRVASLFGQPMNEPLPISRGSAVAILALTIIAIFGPAMWSSFAESDRKSDETPAAQSTSASKKDSGSSDSESSATALDANSPDKFNVPKRNPDDNTPVIDEATSAPSLEGAPETTKLSDVNSEVPQDVDLGNSIVVVTANVTTNPMPNVGMGFFVHKDGYLVTAKYIVDKADSITVTLDDRREMSASVVAGNFDRHLALLKIDEPVDVPVAEYGSSAGLRVGDRVFFKPNRNVLPMAAGRMLPGVVRATKQILRSDWPVPFRHESPEYIESTFDHGDGIGGSSLLDSKGHVVGVNVAGRSEGDKTVFSIPIDGAKPAIDKLLQTALTAKPPRSRAGDPRSPVNTKSDRAQGDPDRITGGDPGPVDDRESTPERAPVDAGSLGASLVRVEARIDQTSLRDLEFSYPDRGRFLPYSAPVNSMGMGFFVDQNGYVLTALHVVEHASFIRLTMNDGSTQVAVVVERDRAHDLALLKSSVQTKIPILPFASSADLKPGDSVSVIRDFKQRFPGAMTAQGRDVEARQSVWYRNLLQTDIRAIAGESGGPLLNEKGQVVGMNVVIRAGRHRMGFATPIDDVKPEIERMVASRKKRELFHQIKLAEAEINLADDSKKTLKEIERIKGHLNEIQNLLKEESNRLRTTNFDLSDPPTVETFDRKAELDRFTQRLVAKLPKGWTLEQNERAFRLRGPDQQPEAERASILLWFSDLSINSSDLDKRKKTSIEVRALDHTLIGCGYFSRNAAAIRLWPKFVGDVYDIEPATNVALVGKQSSDLLNTMWFEMCLNRQSWIDEQGNRRNRGAENELNPLTQFIVVGELAVAELATTEEQREFVKKTEAAYQQLEREARAIGAKRISLKNFEEYLRNAKKAGRFFPTKWTTDPEAIQPPDCLITGNGLKIVSPK